MNKVQLSPNRYFEDLVLGEVLVSSPYTVSEQEIIDFARQYDPQYYHLDPEQAESSMFGGLIASGIHILVLWRKLEHENTGDIHWICGVAWKNLRWKNPLRAGDQIRSRTECLAKRSSRSKPDRGLVEHRFSLLNQCDEDLFYCLSTSLVERRPKEK